VICKSTTHRESFVALLVQKCLRERAIMLRYSAMIILFYNPHCISGNQYVRVL